MILAKFYISVVRNNISEDELLNVGERMVNIKRSFNLREDITRKNDVLPKRVLGESMPDAPAKEHVVNRNPMVSDYYELKVCDRDFGFPKRETVIGARS